MGQNYWRQHLRKEFSHWFKERNKVWEGMKLLEKHKINNDAWVELSGEIWRWHTLGKVAYKSTTKKLVGDPNFISGSKYVQRGADRLWWGWEDVSICKFWILPE